jgi:hypothetical protein
VQKTTISSVCECQATLYAELDQQRHVRRGWARDPSRKAVLPAPAQGIDARCQTFAVGWSCPFCIRNTLRRFDAAMLVWVGQDAETSTGSADQSRDA